ERAWLWSGKGVALGANNIQGGTGTIYSSGFIYDPLADAWSTTAPMPAEDDPIVQRSTNPSLPHDDTVNVSTLTGGLVTDPSLLFGQPPGARHGAGIAALDGDRLLVAGGASRYTVVAGAPVPSLRSSVLVYDTTTDTWTPVQRTMLANRKTALGRQIGAGTGFGAMVKKRNGDLYYLTGGNNGLEVAGYQTLLFHHETLTWSLLADQPTRSYLPALLQGMPSDSYGVVGQKVGVIVAGGPGGGSLLQHFAVRLSVGEDDHMLAVNGGFSEPIAWTYRQAVWQLKLPDSPFDHDTLPISNTEAIFYVP